MEKKNKITIIVSIICTLILLLGGTYAAWNYLTQQTSVTMVVDGDQVSFNAGENITVTGIMPVYSMEEGIVKEIEVYKQNGNYTAGIDLYLNLATWPSVMSSASFRWAIYKNGEYLSSGSFSGKAQGNTIRLTSYTQELKETIDNYTLYLWIDAYQESNINMMNQKFSVNIYGQATFYTDDDPIANEVEPNSPDLADGMIPIKYNYIIDEWVKADVTNTNNNWYDYYNKMWANAVMVTTDTREDYMSAPVGTTVSNDDILAYYVWIPRYKYVLFNVDSIAMDPVEIQIEFQSETDVIYNGTQNGEYLTHPAFWWDNNSNGERESGEELAGIWVGKFETTEVNNEPVIKPNIKSFGKSLYSSYTLNIKFQSTTYITETSVSAVDPHMMKNIEWGAMAYLSHSKYGNMNDVSATGNTDKFTGRNNNYTYNDFYIDGSHITSSKEAGGAVQVSTTGNVYGVFDVSGCINEYLMTFTKNENGEIIYSHSNGFSANNIPESKYYDIYEYGKYTGDYTRRILGDATGETRGWYGGQAALPYYQSTSEFRGLLVRYKLFSISGEHPGYLNRGASRSVLIVP